MDQFNLQITRVPREWITKYAALATATVHEASGRQGAMTHDIRPTAPGLRLCGSALTVRCQAADNLTLHAAVALAQPGDVLVADVGQALEAGHWGEIITVAAQARGIVGLVINGGVRDVGPVARRGFPVFAASISMKATVKESPGLINHPIICGGVLVRPGDLVLGDDDGVVVVAAERLQEVYEASVAREEREAAVMRRLEQGELTLDVLGFRKALERHGLKI
ncbi:MAG: 4-carboxy-4-hydroxy-2-oxoadipate aldolase/oxaloacetate decarboxylase [Anaerolineae bacterium]